MRYDTEHKQRTHDQIVREAAAAIRRHGPDGIGVADLMKRAGLTVGGFYAHFKSKDDLVAETIQHMFDERHEMFRACLTGVPPSEGLAIYVDRYLGNRHRENPEQGCPMPALSGDVARLPAAARKRFEEGVQRLIDSIAEVLRALERPNPEMLAQSAVVEMVGAVAIARALASGPLADRILKSARDGIKGRLGVKR